MKVVRELGLERRETVRFLSTVGRKQYRELRDAHLSTRGLGGINLWCIGCGTSRSAE